MEKYCKKESENPEVFFIDENGVEYKRIRDLVSALGIPLKELRERINKEGSISEAIKKFKDEKEDKAEKNQYIFNGKVYKTQKQLANKLGVNRLTIRALLTKYNNDLDKVYEHVQRYKEKEEANKNKVYTYNGKVFEDKEELAKYLGIVEGTLNQYLKKYNGDIEKIVEQLKGTYYYEGKKFETILELAKYTKIKDSRLEKVIKMCGKNVEKAVFSIRMKDILDKKIWIQLPGHEETQIDVETLSVLLEVKQRELCIEIYRDIFMHGTEFGIDFKTDNRNEKYLEKIKFLEYCMKYDLDFKCYWRLYKMFGNDFEKIIDKNRGEQRRLLKEQIIKQYGALLRILTEKNLINDSNIVKEMRDSNLSVEEIIEAEMLDKKFSQSELKLGLIKNFYALSCTEVMSKEEKKKLLGQISLTSKESECIQFVNDNMSEVNHLIKLNEIAQFLKSESRDEEKNRCLRENNVTVQEIEVIILDLYEDYNIINETVYTEELQQYRKVKRNIVERWVYMTEEERKNLSVKGFFSQEEIQQIATKSKLLEHYKRIIQDFKREEIEEENGEKSSN